VIFVILLESNNNSIAVFLKKANWLQKNGRYEESIECYDKILELDQENIDALNQKSFLLYKIKLYEKSIKCCEKILEIDSENIRAKKRFALNLIRTGKYEDAKFFGQFLIDVRSNIVFLIAFLKR